MAIKSSKAKTAATTEGFKKALAFLNLELEIETEDGIEFLRLQPGAPLTGTTSLEREIMEMAKAAPSSTFVLRGTVRFIDQEKSTKQYKIKTA
jgi:hypothetical protein